MTQPREWPEKRREIQTRVCDSTRWNGFPFRDDDVIVATYAKTGTTWTQQIVGQLIFRVPLAHLLKRRRGWTFGLCRSAR